MRVKRLLKWTTGALLLVLIVMVGWGFISYWTNRNDCDSEAAARVHPMKAIVYCEYGSPDVLKLKQIERLVPNDDQLLIKVRAASLNFVDPGLMRGPFLVRLMLGSGLRKPKKTGLGNDMAGTVASCVAWAGFTALRGLRTGNIASGQKVLVNGASGGVGTPAEKQ